MRLNIRYLGRNNISIEYDKSFLSPDLLNLRKEYSAGVQRSPKNTASSSGFNRSTTSTHIGERSPYWDLMSLEDAKDHEKEMAQKREAKKRAQKQLRTCLEVQMREKDVKDNITKYNFKSSKNDLLLDKMVILEKDHQQKVNS